MIISKYFRKIKGLIGERIDSIFTFLVVFLGSLLVWGLLNLWQQKIPELVVEQLELTDIQTDVPIEFQIIGNKNSKIYHLADCPGALKMNDSNKVFFASVAAAKLVGYRAAKNCSGLKYLE